MSITALAEQFRQSMTSNSWVQFAGKSPVGRGAVIVLAALLAFGAVVGVANLAGLATPTYVLALGALVGVSYGLLGVCTVLIFRVSGVINLALPATGIFAMSFMPMLIDVLHFPWWAAFVCVLPLGFVCGALTEAIVIRRLVGAPRVVGVIASLGVAGVLASGATFAKTLAPDSAVNPIGPPPGMPSFSIGPLVVTPGYSALIIAAPLMTLALLLFLTRSRLGLAVRAAASNPDNARLSAISPALVAAATWGIAGVVATVTIIFFVGNVPTSPLASVVSPDTLLPALGAAAIGAFTNIPRALVGGVILGVVQQIMLWSPDLAPYDDLALLVVLFCALAVGKRTRGRGDAPGAWNAVAGWRPLPADLRQTWSVRALGPVTLVLALAALIFIATRSDAVAQSWTTTICLAGIALTVALVTGVAGELSLGQFGYALVGGGVSFAVVGVTGDFALGLLAATVVAGVVSAIVALPSLRSGGLSLTILTLGVAVTVPSAFLRAPAIFGDRVVTPPQPVIAGIVMRPGIPYFFLTLAIVAFCAFIGWNVWRGGYGRRLRASRDNAPAAAAFGIDVTRARVIVMLISGMLAGLIGAVLVHSMPTASAAGFPVDLNILVVLAVVMGGVGVYFGGPLGALWVFGSAVAQTASTGRSEEATSTASLAIYGSALILILLAPGGAAQLLRPVRDAVAVVLGRLAGVRYTLSDLRGELTLEGDAKAGHNDRAASRASGPSDVAAIPRAAPQLRALPTPASIAGPILQCHSMVLRYGAVTAVDNLSFDLGAGEMLGLIGPNGAGKTSTFELLTGYARPTSGQVLLAGKDITGLTPHRRVARGLVRSFQDAALFGTMTTNDVIQLSLERQRKTNTLGSILGIDPSARRRAAVADEIIDFFGLAPYRGACIAELSTGTRRFVELAALVSMRPRVLLLDEPSSGIAQRESEALAPLLLRLRKEFDLSMIIIEHDVPLIMSIADRVLVMDQGRELTLGTPTQVRADSRVVDAYMGGSLAAVERSEHRQQPHDQPTTDPAPEATVHETEGVNP